MGDHSMSDTLICLSLVNGLLDIIPTIDNQLLYFYNNYVERVLRYS